MKSLNEGYQRLDSIITENHLEEGFDDDLENFIRKQDICKKDMEDYKRLWEEVIMPGRTKKTEEWRNSKITKFLPYLWIGTLTKLDALKALV